MILAGKLRGKYNELENITLDKVDDFPSDPSEGQLVWKSSEKKIYIYNGTEWKEVLIGEEDDI